MNEWVERWTVGWLSGHVGWSVEDGGYMGRQMGQWMAENNDNT